MSEWKKKRLGDLISIKGGFSYKGEFIGKGTSMLLGMGCVSFNEIFLLSGARLYSGEAPETFNANPNDIVLATRQQSDNLPILGAPAIIPDILKSKKVIVGTNLYKVENDSEVKNDFLFWLLRNLDYRNHIDSCAKGSTVKMITKDAVESYEFLCPPEKERNTISSNLWNISKKIDLLHRQNATLEKMAETLFRQWFVKEAKEEWEMGKLEDEFDFVMGQSPLGIDLNETGDGIIFYQGRTDFGFRFPSPRIYTTAPTRLAKRFDTLISVRAPVGDMNMAFEECCLGRGVAAFRYKNNNDFYSYTYYKLRSLMDPIKQFEDNGSVFGSIGKDDFKNLENPLPPNYIIEEFQKEAKPIDDKIILNTTQIRTLTALRDTLLPKLMSGEVRVETGKDD